MARCRRAESCRAVVDWRCELSVLDLQRVPSATKQFEIHVARSDAVDPAALPNLELCSGLRLRVILMIELGVAPIIALNRRRVGAARLVHDGADALRRHENSVWIGFDRVG